MSLIIGIDEAGRGALAGPVVAAAVKSDDIQGSIINIQVQDSKQLTSTQREVLAEVIKKSCMWGIGVIDAEIIDAIGIKKATNRAMRMAVEDLKLKLPRAPSFEERGGSLDLSRDGGEFELWIDGNDRFTFSYPSKDFIKGDEIHPVISAASILAKVHRDHLMAEYAKTYPKFGFETHKGYGAKAHLGLLDREIYCEIHRKTYDPLRTILTQMRLEI